MTEEIIVNGFDVSECYADNEMMKDGLYCFWEGGNCEDNEYCYYKECRRLEQENERLRKANEISIEKVTVTAEAKRLQELEQENKELKSALEEIRRFAGRRFVNGLNAEADHYNKDMQAIEDKINEVLGC